jgi:hypothetical protein
MFLQGIGQRGESKFYYSRKGGSTKKGGIDKYNSAILLLQQGAEIRPYIQFEKSGNHRQGEEGGEPGEAHRRLTLCSPCSRGCGC